MVQSLEEIIRVKEERFHKSIEKLNYYIVGLDLAGLYLLIRFADVFLTEENKIFILFVWVFGSFGFFMGLIWLYRLTQYFLAESEYFNFKNKFNSAAIIRAPVAPQDPDAFIQSDPILKENWDGIEKSQKKMKKYWASGFEKAFLSTLAWNIYRFGSILFIGGLLTLGGLYLSGLNLRQGGLKLDSDIQLQEKSQVPGQFDDRKSPSISSPVNETHHNLLWASPRPFQFSSPAQVQPESVLESAPAPVEQPTQKQP